MHTPFELFYVECGNGWKKLIEPLFAYIEKYNKDKKDCEKIEVVQVKEKYGGLRFHINFGTQELYDLIDKAEEDSYNICEICGSEENVGMTTNGWMQTVCQKCVGQEAVRNQCTYLWDRNSDAKTFIVNTDGTLIEEGQTEETTKKDSV